MVVGMHRLRLLLPPMKPSRFRRWIEESRRIFVDELGGFIEDVRAGQVKEGLAIHLTFRGNCWTYDFDHPHLVALQFALGSRGDIGLDHLVHGFGAEDAWWSERPFPRDASLEAMLLTGLSAAERPVRYAPC